MPTMKIQLEVDSELYPALYDILQDLPVVKRRAEYVRALASDGINYRRGVVRVEKALQAVDLQGLSSIDSPKKPSKLNKSIGGPCISLPQTDNRGQVPIAKGLLQEVELKQESPSIELDIQSLQTELTPAQQATLKMLGRGAIDAQVS